MKAGSQIRIGLPSAAKAKIHSAMNPLARANSIGQIFDQDKRIDYQTMKYLPPFSAIKKQLALNSEDNVLKVNINFDKIEEVVRMLLAGIEVDEDWYRANYPDVDAAIRSGTIASAKTHFVEDGYFEGRIPFSMTVDEDWYLSEYPDIAEAVQAGRFLSANMHFAEFGYEEGRVPSKAG